MAIDCPRPLRSPPRRRAVWGGGARLGGEGEEIPLHSRLRWGVSTPTTVFLFPFFFPPPSLPPS